ncbi:hypothetical protein [uncultured Sunxiuqinia sp.]|uniref:hypothetical protein n=1 Tax=uncultured Sunxiuqinia sp. TaxID=1573825 RepID=UPI00262490DC|nr:hypothetical protein [uncultured Sunxiuqinia sp.]
MKALIVSFLLAGIVSFSFAAEKESKENKAADVLQIPYEKATVEAAQISPKKNQVNFSLRTAD